MHEQVVSGYCLHFIFYKKLTKTVKEILHKNRMIKSYLGRE